MFFIELVAPFGIFLTGTPKKISIYLIILFMLLIFLSGNYTFFNLLTALLAWFVLEDSEQTNLKSWGWIAIAPFGAAYLLISCTQIVDTFRSGLQWPAWVTEVQESVAPFRSVNPYGLFQVMTTQRLEIEIQGSNKPKDEASWKPYVFKFKPGPLERPPLWCQPYQPRLDWQLWFAALSRPEDEPWFNNLLARLLQGNKEVTALLEKNPYPDQPPRYLRAILYEYRFTGFEEKRQSGNWWTRKALRLYSPIVFLTDK
jgi:hypothetical protein